MMKTTLAFDVYGTLVNPAGMTRHLADDIGASAAPAFVGLWREKQLEYSFRRGLMRNYVNFAVCTADAFEYACQHFRVTIDAARRAELMRLNQHLPPFADAAPALEALRGVFRLYAFSNGKVDAVDEVLSNAGLRLYFEGIVSVDDVRSFKPDPAVYNHARRAAGAMTTPFWLISGNPFDIIGARSAGLNAAWIRRTNDVIYDPWGIAPTLTVRALTDLRNTLPY